MSLSDLPVVDVLIGQPLAVQAQPGNSQVILRIDLIPPAPSGSGSGTQGAQGVQGIPGTPGQIRFTGSGAPGTILGANPGDTYLDTTTGTVYTLI